MMRRLFFLVAMPLLFDLLVAACLGSSGPRAASPGQAVSIRSYVVFFDWDGVELSAIGRRTVAAAARTAAQRSITRIEVLGEFDHAAGPAYTAALEMERARRVRAELVRDGLTPTDIGVVGPGAAPAAPRRIQLVLQWTG